MVAVPSLAVAPKERRRAGRATPFRRRRTPAPTTARSRCPRCPPARCARFPSRTPRARPDAEPRSRYISQRSFHGLFLRSLPTRSRRAAL
jgi:hypothetical protein